MKKIFNGKEIFKNEYAEHLEAQVKYWQCIALEEKQKNLKLKEQIEELKETIDYAREVEYMAKLAYEHAKEITYGLVEDDE